MRHDWAQYYDKVEDMDAQVGRLLAELEEEGLAENTIVFYYSDHGGVLGRSKRYLYETGTHVPLIVRIPEKYRKLYPEDAPGAEVDRLVSFVDLAPTLLSLAGTGAPAYMQGRAFLGRHTREAAPYVYMFRDRMDERYDMSRSITDGRYRYTRNFDSDRIYLQHLEYLWRAPSMRSWEQAFLAGECDGLQSRYWGPKPVEELYDSEEDPWEIHNLAGDPACSERLALMREACVSMGNEMRDAGFIPEADRIRRTGGLAAYDYMRQETVPFEKILQAAYVASYADPERLDQLLRWLEDEDSAVRYWAAKGLLLLGDGARPYLDRIVRASFDPSQNVCVTAADLLFRLGERESATAAYFRVLSGPEPMARTAALNSLDLRGGSREVFLDTVVGVLRSYDTLDRQFDARAAKWLLEKWDVDPAAYGVDFSW
jgi:N-sulfoglucosamine sulfohydrolase